MSQTETETNLRVYLEQFLTALAYEDGYARNTVAAYRNDLSQLIEFLGNPRSALGPMSARLISLPLSSRSVR
jgi:site-specific recombinase XerD